MRKVLDPISFRCFVESDVALLGAWLQGSGLGVPEGVAPEVWSRRLSEDPLIRCKAASGPDGEVVGFYRLDMAPDRTAEITIIVDPANRRLGVASAMMSEILAMARREGVCRLLAVVEEGNLVGRQFFLSFDFELRSLKISHYLYFERIIHGAESQPPLEITG